MIYYNADGYLADMNDKACETFGVKDLQALLNRQMKMTDIPSYRELDIRSIEHTQLSSITDINQTKATDERVPEVTRQGKIYYEVMLGPIRNESNQLYGVIAAGRDITEMVESTHKQKEAARLIKKRNNEIQQYISDINYSLKISEARLVNYYPDTHELEILSDLSETGKRIPQLHAVALIHSDDRHKAQHLILHMDRRRLGTISETLHTKLPDKQGRDIYLNFNLMPITNPDGLVTHYFGLLRNDTEMSYTEMRLQEETAKAQEEEQLKNAFLLNMSYELRVPLHAVLGFAELFKTEHNQEDEPIFANEIKKNTDVLLNLINDILFISRLDAHMIEYNYEIHDFATLFDAWCLHGWGETNNKTRKIINNTYESLRVKIDKHNLGIAIEKLCNFIGLSTNEGLIKSRYEYLHDELIVIVDSTDGGMDLEDATKMFDRFVSDGKNKRVGTGLDLPIVKEMIEQMGGTIDVLSEPNKGSSFFIALPCEMIDFERKIER
jgi:PAS domain S-box-containing protein